MERIRTCCLGLAIAALVATATAAGAGAIRPGGLEIEIGPGGPSPSSVHVRSPSLFGWVNKDSVAHTVTLERACTETIAPGERAFCRIADAYRVFTVGTYRYHVSGTAQPEGEIIVVPNLRRVTLAASPTRVRTGRPVALGGEVVARQMGGLYGIGLYHPVTVFRRLASSSKFRPIRRAVTKRHVPSCSPSLGCVNTSYWSVRIRPRETATYVARVSDSPRRQIWHNAESRSVVVRVTPRSQSAP